MGEGSSYPLVVRNVAPLMLRGFMTVFLCGCALITWMIIRDNPEPHRGRR